MTPDIKAIRAAAEAATPGEWIEMDGSRFDPEVVITTKHRHDRSMHEICGLEVGFSGEIGIEQKANAKHIATANPATVIALCDEVERLRKDAARYKKLVAMEADLVEPITIWHYLRNPDDIDAAMESKT